MKVFDKKFKDIDCHLISLLQCDTQKYETSDYVFI